jgi:hypothetical protein
VATIEIHHSTQMNRTVNKHFLNPLLLLAAALPLGAQADLASLTGLITDPSGSSVSGAKVTALGRTTGLSRSTVSDKAGYYTFTSLPIGSYQISVDQAGFSRAATSVMLDPSEKGRQDFQLQVGETTTSIEVSAAPDLARDNASLGTVVENRCATFI